jgi:hypothetical protein
MPKAAIERDAAVDQVLSLSEIPTALLLMVKEMSVRSDKAERTAGDELGPVTSNPVGPSPFGDWTGASSPLRCARDLAWTWPARCGLGRVWLA